MDILRVLWDIDYTLIAIGNYPLSIIELIGTLTGLLSVYLATKAHAGTWPTGILNEAAFFILFYQVQLYSDMILQVFFFGASLYGWRYWKNETPSHRIRWSSPQTIAGILTLLAAGTFCLGLLMRDIHDIFPSLFVSPAQYPFADAFTTTASMVATILMARKQLENWILWIAVDIISIILYIQRHIWFIGLEYLIFLALATYGLFAWIKKTDA